MREYKITKSGLGYNIYKKKEINGLLYVYFLGKEDDYEDNMLEHSTIKKMLGAI